MYTTDEIYTLDHLCKFDCVYTLETKYKLYIMDTMYILYTLDSLYTQW